MDTIAHGELWDRNLLMLDDKVKILDWKNAKLASATLDLAFLMLSSTTSDVRQTCTNDLLKETCNHVFLTFKQKNPQADIRMLQML